MADHWTHAGGAAWLDAVLFDGDGLKGDPLLAGDVPGANVGAVTTEGVGVLDALSSLPRRTPT